MKVGIITKYNGKYGTIKTEDIEVDFEAKDISLGIDLKEGDKVIFRVEQRIPSIYLARNITIYEEHKKMILK